MINKYLSFMIVNVGLSDYDGITTGHISEVETEELESALKNIQLELHRRKEVTQ